MSSSAGTREMAILRGATEQLINGSGGLIEVIGEPGIGKTRLVDEAVAQAGEVTTLRCDCERTGAGTPYTPVRRLLHQVLGTNSSMDPDTIANCLQDCVTTAAPELRPWVSLLGVVLDVTIPPSPEVAELEEQHRAERVPELVADLLERMVPSSRDARCRRLVSGGSGERRCADRHCSTGTAATMAPSCHARRPCYRLDPRGYWSN